MRISTGFTHEDIRDFAQIFYSPVDMPLDSVIEHINRRSFINRIQKYSDIIWLKFKLENHSDKEHFLLEINNDHIPEYELFGLNGDSTYLIAQGGARYPFFEREIINRRFINPVTIPKNESITLILKIIDQGRKTSLSARIWNENTFYTIESRDELFYNLYFGGLIFICLLSIVIGFILRHRLFYAYSMYVFVMAVYMFDNLGFAYQFLYPNQPDLKRFLDVVMIPLLLFVFTNFSSNYFDLKKNQPDLIKEIRVYYASLAALLIFWILSRARLDIYYYILINYLFIATTFVFLGIMSIKGYKMNRRKTLFYSGAVLVLFIGAILFALSDAGYIPMEWFPTNPLLMSSVIEFGIFTAALIYEVYVINKTKNDLLVANTEYQKRMLRAYVQGAEKERSRLSGELHDNIGSRLALLKNRLLNSNVINNDLQAELDSIYQNVRVLSHDLAPESLMIAGFKEYIDNYLNRFSISTGIEVKFIPNDLPPELDEQLSIQLFRIIQEAAHNAQKHSEASVWEVQVMINDNELVLTIDDNGKGFDMQNIHSESKGISNMETRVKSLGGIFEISSDIDKGCHIVVTVPFPD